MIAHLQIASSTLYVIYMHLYLILGLDYVFHFGIFCIYNHKYNLHKITYISNLTKQQNTYQLWISYSDFSFGNLASMTHAHPKRILTQIHLLIHYCCHPSYAILSSWSHHIHTATIFTFLSFKNVWKIMYFFTSFIFHLSLSFYYSFSPLLSYAILNNWWLHWIYLQNIYLNKLIKTR